MCWFRRKRPGSPASPCPPGISILLAGLLALVPTPPAAADAAAALRIPELSSDHEAWLVTYGPGEVYWQRFGHNAIWLREPALGLDHTFNFGYFDFDQENFIGRFVRGRLLYFSLAQPARTEFEGYRRENRAITAQRLNLQPAQYRRLRDHLLETVRPANREYLYDYYLDNCSTRVRDALDLALGGALAATYGAAPAAQGFRDHTRRLTSMDFWYYLGLEAALGSRVDRPISRWEEMFVPAVVADSLASFTAPPGAAAAPLVNARREIFHAGSPPPATPPAVWPRYLLLGALLAAVPWLGGRVASQRLARALVVGWLALAGGGGLVLTGLWGMTDHHAAGANENLLLLNPLLLAALFPGGRRVAALLLVSGVVVSVLLAAVPGGQYMLDVLVLIAPPHLAGAVALWRWPRGGSGTPAQG